MPQTDPSRTEQATPKRRNKARREGNVPKSQELSKVCVLLAGLVALWILIGFIGNNLTDIFLKIFGNSLTMDLSRGNLFALLTYCSSKIALMVLPVLFLLALIAFVSVRLQVGSLWTTKVFEPKLGKTFNVVAGVKRLFISTQTMVRLLRSLLQACAVGLAPYLVLKSEFHNLIPLFYTNVQGTITYMLATGAKMVMYALVPMILIAVADLFYTRWEYEEKLKMTKHETKDERKQAEGNPEVRAAQRKKMMTVMQRRMLRDVPSADVIITNPTHLAVALRYDLAKAPAPMVLAKGADFLAEKIKGIAREHNVPIKENKPLAQALYKSVAVGETIPEELYQAVASILAQLHRFKAQAR